MCIRDSGKIIQELEGVFRGAGWNVVKVIWGSRWDQLLASAAGGKLVQLMNECVDGDYQTFKSRNGKYVRDEFFGRYPETKALVEGWTDDEIWALQRGGHDSVKVYAAYKAASEHRGQPTVVIAKTIKGYGMGEAGEGQNIAHQAKKMELAAMQTFRDRFALPISDDAISADKVPFFKPAEDSAEMRYLRERTKALGSVPQRRRKSNALAVPDLTAFDAQLQGTGDRSISTTMAFVRVLNTVARDREIGAVSYTHLAGAHGGGRKPARAPPQIESSGSSRLGRLRRAAAGNGRSQHLDHDGVRASSQYGRARS